MVKQTELSPRVTQPIESITRGLTTLRVLLVAVYNEFELVGFELLISCSLLRASTGLIKEVVITNKIEATARSYNNELFLLLLLDDIKLYIFILN